MRRRWRQRRGNGRRVREGRARDATKYIRGIPLQPRESRVGQATCVLDCCLFLSSSFCCRPTSGKLYKSSAFRASAILSVFTFTYQHVSNANISFPALLQTHQHSGIPLSRHFKIKLPYFSMIICLESLLLPNLS